MRRLLFVSLVVLLAGCASTLPPAIIFFEDGSAELDGTALAAVRQAAANARARPQRIVAVRGYASPEGEPEANRALARARAEAVARALRAEAIGPERIALRPRGATPYVDAPLESRRVEIVIDP